MPRAQPKQPPSKMPPLLRPSLPPSKEPPDKPNTYLPLSALPTTINTSITMNPDQSQPSASPYIRPPFNPFFTLIHDTTTSTTHHPRNVHYIFSDDDPSLVTTACLSALSSSPTASYPSPSRARASQTQNPSTSSSSAASKSPSSSTAHGKARENRILLLDLNESGTSVTQAHSLSSSWQILSTSLTPAPTWDESPTDPHVQQPQGASSLNSGPGGFMLKISGTDGRQVGAGQGMGLGLGLGKDARGIGGKGEEEKGEQGFTETEFQALVEEFEARMKVLRTVVEAGGEVGRRGEGLRVGEGEEGEATAAEREGVDTALIGER